MKKYLRFFFILFLTLFFSSCHKDNKKDGCPIFEWFPPSPYSSPICHPSKKIIGFNYLPIKEIKYTYGYNCPLQASYIYDYSNSGFWLMDGKGQNPRRVLPYFLLNPSWSPDGKWIIFSDGDICKMSFDGNCFDTINIIRLTNTGHNFYPAWSPTGKNIAFENSDCGSVIDSIPPNSCGILIMDTLGGNKRFITKGTFPFWRSSEDTIYLNMQSFDLINMHINTILDIMKIGFVVESVPMFNSQKKRIFFLGRYQNIPGHLKLYSIDITGENFVKVSDDPISDFTCTPDGKIIYLLFNNERIDEEMGTLWIMDENGINKSQLTFNHFSISFN